MLRNSVFGRILGINRRSAVNGLTSSWQQLARPFSSGGSAEEDLEVVEDETEVPAKGKSKPSDYQFFSKNIAVVVENPLFPFNSKVVHLGRYHSKLLNTRMPLFVTCILRKELEEVVPPHEKSKSTSMVGKEVTEDFYSLGTYCSVEYNKEAPNRIVAMTDQQNLTCIHKVEVRSITEYTLAYEEENDISQISGVMSEVGQEDLREEELSPVKVPVAHQIKDEHKPMESFLRAGIQAMKDQPRHRSFDENKLHIVEVDKVFNQKVQLDTDERIKLEHMVLAAHQIELSKRIMTIQNLPFMQDSPLNFNDIELYLDLYAAFILKSKFFDREEILPAFLERSVPERLSIVHNLMKKYHLLLSNMNQIGVDSPHPESRPEQHHDEAVERVLQRSVQRAQEPLRRRKKKPEVYRQIERSDGQQDSAQARAGALLGEPQAPDEFEPRKLRPEHAEGLPRVDRLDPLRREVQRQPRHRRGAQSARQRPLRPERRQRPHLGVRRCGQAQELDQREDLAAAGPARRRQDFSRRVDREVQTANRRALGRSYERISLGGESDSSVLKGHRRTYVGAYPGKIVTALKKCGTENCVIILDEIDKLGRSNHHGDPQSNLLEILDPNQNKSFVDNYLDYPIDLSNVLFICTANTLNTISAPLLDRMDVITLSSYTMPEKKNILQKHLLPKATKEAGLSDANILLLPGTEEKLINDYCREPGVRSLDRHIRKIADKIAFEIVTKQENSEVPTTEPIQISPDTLKNFVGNPLFDKENLYSQAPPGVAIGLAFTQLGGSILFLEAKKATFTRNAQAPGLKFTGTLGSVMSESMRLAYTFSRNFLNARNVDFLEQ